MPKPRRIIYRRQASNGDLWVGAWSEQHGPIVGVFLSLNPNERGWQLNAVEALALVQELREHRRISLPHPHDPWANPVIVELDDGMAAWVSERVQRCARMIGEP